MNDLVKMLAEAIKTANQRPLTDKEYLSRRVFELLDMGVRGGAEGYFSMGYREAIGYSPSIQVLLSALSTVIKHNPESPEGKVCCEAVAKFMSNFKELGA